MTENEELATIQLTILWYAVRALIETHPNRPSARAAFDREYDRAHANLLVEGELVPAFQRAAVFVASLWT